MAVEAKEKRRTFDLKILRVCCWDFLNVSTVSKFKAISEFESRYNAYKDGFGAYKYTVMTSKHTLQKYLWEKSGRKKTPLNKQH